MSGFNRMRVWRIVASTGIACVLIAGLLVVSTAPVAADDPELKVFPPSAEPYDMTLGEWGAEWQKWRLSFPDAEDPVKASGDIDCSLGQSGKVWYLAGSAGPGPVVRNCTVPAGKSLLFPVMNFAYLSWPIDVPWDGACEDPDPEHPGECYQRPTEEFVSWLIEFYLGTTSGLTATIDGQEVLGLDDYRQVSPLFDAWIPEGNIIDLDPGFHPDHERWGEGISGPHAQEGWYVMTKKLKEGGEHEIKFSGTWYTGWDWEWDLDVTYNITVGEQ